MKISTSSAVSLLLAPLLTSLVGCSAIVMPLPPPSPTIVSLDPVAEGEIEVGAGLNGLLDEEFTGTGTVQAPNLLGGSSPGHIALGLNERLTLTGSYGGWALGHNAGASLGIKLVDGPIGGVSAVVGSGVYLHRNSYNTEIQPTDEDGEPIPDAEPETITTRYAYLGLAPTLGLQTQVNLGDRLKWLTMARVSYSQTFGLYGLDRDDQLGTLYPEATTGLQLEVLDNLHIGAGIYGTYLEDMPLLGGTVSFSGTFERRR